MAQAVRDLWPVFQAILEALVERRMALEQARLRQPGVGPVSPGLAASGWMAPALAGEAALNQWEAARAYLRPVVSS